MEKEKLIEELATNLKTAETKAEQVKINVDEIGDKVFIQHEKKSYINPKYISFKKYFELEEFEFFVKKYADLKEDDVDEILKAKFVEFAFLRKLNNTFETFLEDVRNHGANAVAIMCCSKLLYSPDPSFNI